MKIKLKSKFYAQMKSNIFKKMNQNLLEILNKKEFLKKDLNQYK